MKKTRMLFFVLMSALPFMANAATVPASSSARPAPASSTQSRYFTSSISSNIAAVNIPTGNGMLQDWVEKQLNIKNDHGIRFGGAWLGDSNDLFSGGVSDAKKWTFNSLFLFVMTIDTKKLINLDGGLIGAQFLQFNGQATNEQAGTIQGYNSLPGPRPLSRSELYQLWYRQELFDKKLLVRVGKSIPTDDFNNVSKPVPLKEENLVIPSVSGLLYTPLFVNTSMLGVIPGYYNSAYGVTVTFAPSKRWYISYGGYDGSGAQGVQTGLTGPSFNGAYFNIVETGSEWLLGKNNKPGNIGVGAWHQSGHINDPPTVNEKGASGYYLFGTQRLWYRNPGLDASGISAFYQYGKNNSDALPMTQYIGAGLTAFGLVPHRKNDSMGIGTSFSWLNHHSFNRSTELMYQAYYQAEVAKFFYLEPAISYIPTPGASKDLSASWAWTLRAILLF